MSSSSPSKGKGKRWNSRFLLSFSRSNKGKEVDRGALSGDSTSLSSATPPGVMSARGSSSFDISTTPNSSGMASTTLAPPSAPLPLETSGLFRFPPRDSSSASSTSRLADEVAVGSHGVDIVAVHGLGGHWLTTWQAGDGAIWLRDRVPALLSNQDISCRVRSFGYDSAMIMTHADTDITGCATDLLNRTNAMRSTEADMSRPIIFVAHSLGGLVVKEALNIAWTQARWYSNFSTSVKGCIFMGVPHRGADIARLGKHGTSILELLSMGFAGNSNFLSSLERSSKDWPRISRDFVEQADKLVFKSFYETMKTGNMIVVDAASATLHHSNEQIFPLPRTHRAICRFSDTDDNVFEVVGHAVTDIVKRSMNVEGPSAAAHRRCLISDIPSATDKFFGRRDELKLLRDTLDPSKPAMKGVVLSGISGSGKTQLVRRHIQEHEDLYTAIIWVNASSEGAIEASYATSLDLITKFWPNDRPVPLLPGQSPTTKALTRLRSTMHTKWLLVLDSADDPDALDFRKYIPRCKHGSVVVTSTRRSTSDAFENMGFVSQEIDSLADLDGVHLLLSISNPRTQDNEHTESDDRRALAIVRELHGIPLALEHAGVLLRKQIVSLDNFIENYRKQYHLLMKQQPPRWLVLYEKTERSLIAVLSMIYSLVEESPHAAALLTCLGMLGPRKIRSDVLRGFGNAWIRNESGSHRSALGECLLNEIHFNLSKAYLLEVFLVRRHHDFHDSQEHLSAHGIICKWIVEMVLPHQPSDILRIVEGLAEAVRSGNDSPLAPYQLDYQSIDRGYLLILHRCLDIMGRFVPADTERENWGVVNRISMHLGYILLSQNKCEEAIRKFDSCIQTERNRDAENWPSTQLAVELLFGRAIALQKSGDLSQSREILTSVLPLAEKLFGTFDDRTAQVSSRLKAVSEREETNLQHHKRALIASTPKSERPSAETRNWTVGQYQGEWQPRHAEAPASPLNEGVKDIIFRGPYRTPLSMAAEDGLEDIVDRLVQEGADIEAEDESGRTPLSWASGNGREVVVQRLIEKGADVKSKDLTGRTPLLWAAKNGQEAVVRQLLEKGADTEAEDRVGWTPLSWAAWEGHEAVVKQLLAKGADIESRDQYGWTPRRWAALSVREAIVRLLEPKI